MSYKFSKRESRLTLRRRLRCIRRKIFPQGKAVVEDPVLFIKSGELADDPAVEECAEDRAPFYAHKMPRAEGKKAHRNAEKAACADVSGFKTVNINTEIGRYLLQEQLIDLRRNIGVEHCRNTCGAEKHPRRIVDTPQCNAAGWEHRPKKHKRVQHNAVDDRSNKRKQI